MQLQTCECPLSKNLEVFLQSNTELSLTSAYGQFSFSGMMIMCVTVFWAECFCVHQNVPNFIGATVLMNLQNLQQSLRRHSRFFCAKKVCKLLNGIFLKSEDLMGFCAAQGSAILLTAWFSCGTFYDLCYIFMVLSKLLKGRCTVCATLVCAVYPSGLCSRTHRQWTTRPTVGG